MSSEKRPDINWIKPEPGRTSVMFLGSKGAAALKRLEREVEKAERDGKILPPEATAPNDGR